MNAEDVFFFRGDQAAFDAFLGACGKITGLTGLKIVVHRGTGRAKSPWDKGNGVECDWEIRGWPASWKTRDPKATGYVLELHVWEEGRIQVVKDRLPAGMVVEKAAEPARSPDPARVLDGTNRVPSELPGTPSASGPG